jgi:branched-chain amino acid transport system ATP-binding protein
VSAPDTQRVDAQGLEIEDVSVSFGGVQAVGGVTLQVRAGEILGLIGPNGAGKSTLLNLITGHAAADSGTIRFDGREVTRWSVHRRARLGLARSYQTTTVFRGLTVHENVWMAAAAPRISHFRLHTPRSRRDELNAECAQALDATGLTGSADVAASSLGHGEARALEVAMLVASGARTMLLDEPAAGMAAGEVGRMIDTIRLVHERTGATMMVVEHKLPVIFDLCERVAVLDQGHLLAVGSCDEITRHDGVRRAYLGESLV